MSLEVLLIPFGIAAIAAIREARSTSDCERCRATNVSDQGLLVASLHAMGASEIVQAEGRVNCRTAFGPLTFVRVGDVFMGRVDGGADHQTTSMVAALGATAGGIAQQRMVETVQERASQMGMTLVSQTGRDGSVTLVYEVAR